MKHNHKDQTLEEWANESGIPIRTIKNRIKLGWSTKDTLETPALIQGQQSSDDKQRPTTRTTRWTRTEASQIKGQLDALRKAQPTDGSGVALRHIKGVRDNQNITRHKVTRFKVCVIKDHKNHTPGKLFSSIEEARIARDKLRMELGFTQ